MALKTDAKLEGQIKQIKQYLHAQCTDEKHKEPCNSTYVSYYKLPSIGNFST